MIGIDYLEWMMEMIASIFFKLELYMILLSYYLNNVIDLNV